MTEPIKNITFGGVQFNENNIKQKQKTKDKNGNTMYSVFLKNGVKIEYPEQPKQALEGGKLKYYDRYGNERTKEDAEQLEAQGYEVITNIQDIHPKVTTSVDGFILKDYYTNIEDIQGAKITGSDNVDYIKLTGYAQNNKIDVSADKNFRGDEVKLNEYHNEVTLDKSDTAIIKGKEVNGPGTADSDSY